MIYDRPYMQSDYDRQKMSALAWILGGSILVFIIQNAVEMWVKRPDLVTNYVYLSLYAMKRGFAWTLITHGFVHLNLLHLIGNLLGIFFFGREVLQVAGTRRFVGMFLAALFVGGIFSTVVAVAVGGLPGVVVGSSAAVTALLAFYACYNPDRPITFLLFFVVPVTIKPKHLALITLSIAAFSFLFFELPAASVWAVPPSSLLGGYLTGWVCFRYVHNRGADSGDAKPVVELPAWLRKRKKSAAPTNYKVNVVRPQDIRAEVDRILDKINSQGFGALTEEERRVLDDARDILNKH